MGVGGGRERKKLGEDSKCSCVSVNLVFVSVNRLSSHFELIPFQSIQSDGLVTLHHVKTESLVHSSGDCPFCSSCVKYVCGTLFPIFFLFSSPSATPPLSFSLSLSLFFSHSYSLSLALDLLILFNLSSVYSPIVAIDCWLLHPVGSYSSPQRMLVYIDLLCI